MSIICLGWGSLIWRYEPLRLVGHPRPWHTDGPALSVELVRQSNDGRMTLVLTDTAAAVPVLWAEMDYATVDDARFALGKREAPKAPDPISATEEWMGSSRVGDSNSERSINEWASARHVSAVLWTSLPPRFDHVARAPTNMEVVRYLRSLSGEQRVMAEDYVRRAPPQIATLYRVEIEAELGWTYDGALTAHRIID